MTEVLSTRISEGFQRISQQVNSVDAKLLKDNLRKLILDLTHPIGCYYWSSDSTTPDTLFGGTWEQITDKFVYAAGTKAVDVTGGEETHTLTVAEMPSHSHNIYAGYPAYSSGSGRDVIEYDQLNYDQGYVNGAYNLSPIIQYTGGGGSHNNMPPYIVAYCWRHTA